MSDDRAPSAAFALDGVMDAAAQDGGVIALVVVAALALVLWACALVAGKRHNNRKGRVESL